MFGLLANNIDLGNPVDWGNPLNRGLVSWWLPLPNNSGGSELFDLAKHTKFSLIYGSGNNYYWRPNGVYFTGQGDTEPRPSAQSSVQLVSDNDPLTMIVSLRQAETSAVSRCFAARGQDGSGSGWSAAITGNSSSPRSFTASVVKTDGGAAAVSAVGSITSGWTDDVTLALVWQPGSGGYIKLYVNGRLDATTSHSNSTMRSSTLYEMMGGKGPESFSAPGTYKSFHVFRSALSDSAISYWYQEHRFGYKNTLNFSRRAMFLPVSAAGGGAVGNPWYYYQNQILASVGW